MRRSATMESMELLAPLLGFAIVVGIGALVLLQHRVREAAGDLWARLARRLRGQPGPANIVIYPSIARRQHHFEPANPRPYSECAATIGRLCHLPQILQEVPGASIWSIVEESGIVLNPGCLTAANCEAYLRQNPWLTYSWQAYSEDKRRSGWYMTGAMVGHCPNGPELRYEDAIHACAQFVVREIRDITDQIAGRDT
jgi:hypothetical protein